MDDLKRKRSENNRRYYLVHRLEILNKRKTKKTETTALLGLHPTEVESSSNFSALCSVQRLFIFGKYCIVSKTQDYIFKKFVMIKYSENNDRCKFVVDENDIQTVMKFKQMDVRRRYYHPL